MNTSWPSTFHGARWYDSEEASAVEDVVRQQAPFRYYGINPPRHVAALEDAATRFYGTTYALAVNSGTGALFTAVRALGIGPGDEVVVPSFMWVSTIGAVVAANAIPVLCEVDDSFTMDPADLARKITRRTKLIIPVHMAGAPCNMRRIMAIARSRDIPVLEDCAQANGATFHGKPVGAFGTVGMFSLQVNKNITSGEGGLLITRNRALYRRLCAAHDVGVPWRNGGPDTSMGVACWGEGRRMGELAGAVASAQYRKLRAIVIRMRTAKRRLKNRLTNIPGLSFRSLNDEAGDSGSALILLLPNADTASSAASMINAEGLPISRIADYGMHVYYNIPQLVRKTPLSPAGNPWNLPANQRSRYSYSKGACPASDALFDRSLLLSVPAGLTAIQASWAANVINKAVRTST
jgi:8-amino-3,8-dideoxy-alpha-D-manno-octulosonate transaminase